MLRKDQLKGNIFGRRQPLSVLLGVSLPEDLGKGPLNLIIQGKGNESQQVWDHTKLKSRKEVTVGGGYVGAGSSNCNLSLLVRKPKMYLTKKVANAVFEAYHCY